MKRLMLFFATAVLITGCATHPVAPADAKPVPADRVFAYQPTGDANSSTITIARDEGMQSKQCPLAVYVDGTLAAHLRTGEVATLEVPAGNHVIGASPAGKGLCAMVNEAAHRREVSVTTEPGSRTKLRLAIAREGLIQISPTAF